MFKNFKKQTHCIRAFTLVELLVSMSIFTAVMTMAVGTLLTIVDANAKAQNMQEVMTNLTFALDSMTREIRTGSGYYCNTSSSLTTGDRESVMDCAGDPAISIVEGGTSLTGAANTTNSRIAYRYNATDKSIERKIGDYSDSNDWFPLTSPDVVINDMYFVVRNTSLSDDKQPNVTIYIDGVVKDISSLDAGFLVQTTVTKRTLDL